MRALPDLSPLYERQGITDAGRKLVEHIRHSEPERRVAGGGSVSGVIPIDTMHVGIQYESRTNERRFTLRWRFDPTVIEFWDQPTTLNLAYHNKAGRKIHSSHIPDYLRISELSIDFFECKPAAKLAELHGKYPDRFCPDQNGRWISPAGTNACSPYGIGYQVALPTDVPAIFVRNADFLYDYVRAEPSLDLEPQITKVKQLVEEKKIIRLDALLDASQSPDAVYYAIGTCHVHFLMDEQLLCRPERSYVFYSSSYAEAMSFAVDSQYSANHPAVQLAIGVEVLWDSKKWTVANFGDGQYSLIDESGGLVRLPEIHIATLVRDGHIRPKENQGREFDEAREILLTASPEEIADGVRKGKILIQLAQGVKGLCSVPARTIREWKRQMRDAAARYGNGFIGLIGRFSRRGRRGSHLNPIMDSEIALSIDEDYLTASPRRKIAAYRLYVVRCRTKHTPYASYKTYRSRIDQLDLELRTERRHGRKAAYQVAGPVPGSSVSRDILPTHGDRAFELAHADHTELPIDLVSAITGQVLGRPWLSVLIDAYTRVVLAYFITFEPPSYRALMMLLRECARRFGRFPAKCITDWGKEFESVYFETLLTSHFVERMHRVTGEPRYGSLIEKINATSQSQFVEDLMGNTTNLMMIRSLSGSHYPEHHAVWTPDAFDNRLGEWFYDQYPQNRHLGIHERPADRMARSLASSGSRPIRLFAYDEDFIRETLPAPERETRCIRKGTIKLNHVPYVGSALDDSSLWGVNVPVRYDPYDISYIYAYVARRWERLRTNSQLILEYTEREIRMAHMEVYARCRDSNREYLKVPEQMIDFLRDVHNQERHLLGLRKYNQERSAEDLEPVPEPIVRSASGLPPSEPVRIWRRNGGGGHP